MKFEINNPSSTSIPFSVSVKNTGLSADNVALCYISVTYSRGFNFEGKPFSKIKTPAVNDNIIRIDFTNFKAGNTPVIYCKKNRTRNIAVKTGSTYRALLPNPGSEQELYITSDEEFLQPTFIKPIKTFTSTNSKFTDFSLPENQGNYIILTHKTFYSEAQNYAAYRSLEHTVIIVDIDELYDQFGYGVMKHCEAIRAFIRYASSTWQIKPKYLLILGKGIHLSAFRNNTKNYASCYVPSFGFPSSDFALSFNALGKQELDVAVGRIAARTKNR
ncbi:MAG: C25 family cysteine peptidase, partial [Bacteroidales bacterium]